MSDVDGWEPEEAEKDLVIQVIRLVIESAARYGDIRLEGRTDEEIKNDIHEYIRARLAEPNTFASPVQYDYQSELINEAQRYEGNGDFNLALMFYATWFEHWLNGMIVAREPMVVLEREEIIRLIRETNLASKTGHIWHLSVRREASRRRRSDDSEGRRGAQCLRSLQVDAKSKRGRRKGGEARTPESGTARGGSRYAAERD